MTLIHVTIIIFIAKVWQSATIINSKILRSKINVERISFLFKIDNKKGRYNKSFLLITNLLMIDQNIFRTVLRLSSLALILEISFSASLLVQQLVKCIKEEHFGIKKLHLNRKCNSILPRIRCNLQREIDQGILILKWKVSLILPLQFFQMLKILIGYSCQQYQQIHI